MNYLDFLTSNYKLLNIGITQHILNTRKTEKYEVNFAKTERLKKGSIITMQTYLNHEEKEIRKRNFG